MLRNSNGLSPGFVYCVGDKALPCDEMGHFLAILSL